MWKDSFQYTKTWPISLCYIIHLPTTITSLLFWVFLLNYDASNLSATNLPESDFMAFADPIKIKFSDVQSAPNGSVPKCVWFDLHGLVKFSNLTSANECCTIQLAHFSIVTESISSSRPPSRGEDKKTNRKLWIIVASALGGLALLALLAFLVLWARKCKQRKRMQEMEKAAEVGEALHMTSVGVTKAPYRSKSLGLNQVLRTNMLSNSLRVVQEFS